MYVASQSAKLLLLFGDKSRSSSEGYQTENIECKLHVNCHLAGSLLLVMQLVTVIDADGVRPI